MRERGHRYAGTVYCRNGPDRKRYKGGGGGVQTVPVQQQSSSAPWTGQQPYLAGGTPTYYTGGIAGPGGGTSQEMVVPGLFQEARQWYDSDQPQYFPGQTVAGFNPMQTQAIDRTAQIAGSNPLMDNAYGTASAYAAGDFSNPAIQGAMDANRAAIMPAVDARFGMAGRSFSPGHAGALGSAITNANAPLLFGAQSGAISAAPGLSAARYNDPNMLLQAGQTQQAQSQAEKNAEIERWNSEQFQRQNKIAALQAMLGGTYGGQSLTTGTQAIQGGGGLGGWGSFLGGAGSAANALKK